MEYSQGYSSRGHETLIVAILQYDNAEGRYIRSTTEKMNESELGVKEWAKLDQPPYSPDTTPSNFQLW